MPHISEQHTQPIIDALDQARQPTGWSRSRTFTTWLDIVLATLQRDDETYLTHVETIERDGDPQPVFAALARAFGDLFAQTTTIQADILGTIYERYGLTSDAAGQHFTPANAATTLAKLQAATTALTTATPDDPFRIADPTCGSGRLLLAMNRYLTRMAPETPVLFAGQDIDPRCAQMTAINFALAGLPGYVTHGDSLAGTAIATWQIDPTRGFEKGSIQDVKPTAVTGSTDTTTTAHQQATTHNQLTLTTFNNYIDTA
jgi:hypothetical protein